MVDSSYFIPSSLIEKLKNSDRIHNDPSFLNEMNDFVENDILEGIDRFTYLRKAFDQSASQILLDFGCDSAPHKQYIENIGYIWHGIDVVEPKNKIQNLTIYDGNILPFSNSSFDVVFSNNSLEHIQDMNLFSEIYRILKPNGHFISNLPFLWPYHSFCTWNYSPFGIKVLMGKTGFTLKKVHPLSDALTVIGMKLLRTFNHFDLVDEIIKENLGGSSSLNKFLVDELLKKGRDIKSINCLRLQYCGDFTFHAQKLE